MSARDLLTHAAYWWIERDYQRHAQALAPELAELGLKRIDATPGGWEATFVTPAAAEIANMRAMSQAAEAEKIATVIGALNRSGNEATAQPGRNGGGVTINA